MLLALFGFIQPAITIDNLTDGDVLRYPVALLRGSSTSGLHIQNGHVTESGGKYKALVELKPGPNTIKLQSGPAKKQIRLIYQPQTSEHFVRVIYLTAQDGEIRNDKPNGWPDEPYQSKLDTVAKLLQTFSAESMNEGGHGRKTFNLEFDKNGKVVVHTLAYPASRSDLWKKDMNQFWGELYGWLDKKYPFDKNKCLVVMGFTHFDPTFKKVYAHTALGGGGLGLFSNGAMWSWPTTLAQVGSAFTDATPVPANEVQDDSAYRSVRWALASTTIGAMMHEMGHTFGLPHTSDPHSIMTRGFDQFNRVFTVVEPVQARRPAPYVFPHNDIAYWGPVDAAELAFHRWFQPDKRAFIDANPPSARIDGKEWVVTAPNGLAMVKFFLSRSDKSGGDVDNPLTFRFYKDPIKEVRLDPAAIAKEHGAAAVRIRMMDREGNITEFDPAAK